MTIIRTYKKLIAQNLIERYTVRNGADNYLVSTANGEITAIKYTTTDYEAELSALPSEVAETFEKFLAEQGEK